MIEDLAISPDGRIVAFQFSPAPDGPRGLGLYDWQAGTLTRIPNPDGKQLGVPRFSYDGKRLAVVIADRTESIKTDIAIVDLSTMAVTQITHDHSEPLGGKAEPVFQPGTDNILYMYGGSGIYSQLKLVNYKTGDERIILDKNNGFILQIFSLYFSGTDEVYFQSIAPVNPSLQKEVDNLTGAAHGVSSIISYRLRFGGQPEVLFPEIERHRIDQKGLHHNLCSLTISESARSIYFIDGVNFGKNEIYNYDLFEIVNNKLERITNINSYLSFARVSYDGSAVAFMIDLVRQRNPRLRRNDIFIYDTKNKSVISTNVLEKMKSDSRFLPR